MASWRHDIRVCTYIYVYTHTHGGCHKAIKQKALRMYCKKEPFQLALAVTSNAGQLGEVPPAHLTFPLLGVKTEGPPGQRAIHQEPDPVGDPKHRSTFGPVNLHHRSIGVRIGEGLCLSDPLRGLGNDLPQ